jgi:hypothetical protein
VRFGELPAAKNGKKGKAAQRNNEAKAEAAVVEVRVHESPPPPWAGSFLSSARGARGGGGQSGSKSGKIPS